MAVAVGAIVVISSIAAAPGWQGLLGAALAGLMLGIAVVDGRRYVIPDALTVPAFLLGLVHETVINGPRLTDALLASLTRAGVAALALLAVLLIYKWVRGQDGLGFGDVKLAAVAGAWLNALTILGVIEAAALTAIAVTLYLGRLRTRQIRRRSVVPFGLYFAPMIWLGWLTETVLARWFAL